MEGIMTGIKPRKMFDKGSLNPEDQGILSDVRRKMNLVDVISGSGASPLGDPLTQFLLQTGQNLIGGSAAGGTKLQEIVGATKDPLAQAVKAQQLKDLSKRKLATSLISKVGTGSFSKAYKEYGQYMIDPKTKKPYTEEGFRPVYGSLQMFRKPMNPGERAEKAKDARKEVLAKKKNMLQQQEYNTLEISGIEKAEEKILQNDALYKSMDTSNPYVGKDDYEVGQSIKVKNKDGAVEERRVYVPDDKDDFTKNKKYFLFNEGIFVVFDGNRLIEDTTISGI
tara:strand:- start:1053 stop:1895 length:843 start_codon:yes stop_codon:yes gene_type:complete